MSRPFLAIGLAMVIAGCTAFNQQKAMPPRTDDSQFKNLKVLPPNIEHDELIETMRGFARSLGVRCGFCHVQTATTPREIFDFPSDEKEEKQIAREMYRMTERINRDVARLGGERQRVTCMTCHRGHEEPEVEAEPATAQPSTE
jgi:predicted trehalose synthase